MQITRNFTLLTFGFLAIVSASAQTTPKNESGEISSPTRLPEVHVNAYRVPTLSEEASEGVTVITREEIEKRNPATGVDLFRQIPGLQIDQVGGAGGLSSVYIRGSDPNHVLVLIDGVRVNDPTNSRGGGFDMSNLHPNSVERIEVLRGPASALYGADAMGGVINIVTNQSVSGATRIDVGGGIGGQAYGNANGRVSGGNEFGGFSIGASRLRDGVDDAGGRIDLTTFIGSARLLIGSRANLHVDARHTEQTGTSFPDDSGGLLYSVRRTLDQKRSDDSLYSARLNWDISNRISLNTSLSSFGRSEDIASAGVAPGVRSAFGLPASVSRTNFDRKNVLGNLVFHLPFKSELSVGAEYQHEDGTNDTAYKLFGMLVPARFSLQRNTVSQFLELKWHSIDNLIVRAGMRSDAVSGFDSNTSLSAGIRYNIPATGGALKANYSEGFKPPSFFALGLPVALGGNPNLSPERSRGGDVGYEQTFWNRRANAGMFLFKTKYHNLVDFNNTINQLVNDQNVDVRGGEAEFTLRPFDSLSFRSHYTRLITNVADTNMPLRQRPGVRAGVQIFYDIDERSRFSWSTEYVADVFDSSIPTGNLMLASYARSDAAYTYRLKKWLNSSVAVDNLFSRRYESFEGFVNPGLRLRFTLMAMF